MFDTNVVNDALFHHRTSRRCFLPFEVVVSVVELQELHGFVS